VAKERVSDAVKAFSRDWSLKRGGNDPQGDSRAVSVLKRGRQEGFVRLLTKKTIVWGRYGPRLERERIYILAGLTHEKDGLRERTGRGGIPGG